MTNQTEKIYNQTKGNYEDMPVVPTLVKIFDTNEYEEPGQTEIQSCYDQSQWTLGVSRFVETGSEIVPCSNGFHASLLYHQCRETVSGSVIGLVTPSGDYNITSEKIANSGMTVNRAWLIAPMDVVRRLWPDFIKQYGLDLSDFDRCDEEIWANAANLVRLVGEQQMLGAISEVLAKLSGINLWDIQSVTPEQHASYLEKFTKWLELSCREFMVDPATTVTIDKQAYRELVEGAERQDKLIRKMVDTLGNLLYHVNSMEDFAKDGKKQQEDWYAIPDFLNSHWKNLSTHILADEKSEVGVKGND